MLNFFRTLYVAKHTHKILITRPLNPAWLRARLKKKIRDQSFTIWFWLGSENIQWKTSRAVMALCWLSSDVPVEKGLVRAHSCVMCFDFFLPTL